MTPYDVSHRIYADFLMPSRLPRYRATLQLALEAGYEIVSIERFSRALADGAVDPLRRYLILRHDIDTDPRTAAAMFTIDQELGIRGSYYFRLSTLDVNLMHAIDQSGGEASYHYEELATIAKGRGLGRLEDVLRCVPDAQRMFERNLGLLRARTGLPMRVAASHGDFVNRRLRVPNWAILVDRTFRQEVGIDLETYDDAFMQHVASRHSDAGYPGTWTPEDAPAAIRNRAAVIYLLVHPRHWTVNRVANAKEDAKRLGEGLRYEVALRRFVSPLAVSGEWAASALFSRELAPETSPELVPDRWPPALAKTQAATASIRDGRAHLFVQVPRTYAPERRYIIDVVLSEWLGLDFELATTEVPHVAIRLAGDPNGRELVLPDVLFATPESSWLTEASMPSTPLARIGKESFLVGNPAATDRGNVPDLCPASLPVLFGLMRPGENILQETSTGLALHVDVFGSVFFLLTRYEEIVRRYEDDHGRFPGFASIAASEGFLDSPLADEYVDLLWLAMRTLWPSLERREWAFRLRLTHDVDQPWSAHGLRQMDVVRGVAGDLLRRHDPALAVRRARSLWVSRQGHVENDPFDTFDLLMDVSERHNLRSTFYFQAGASKSEFDATYRLQDPNISRLLRRIHDRGHEIGLHGSYHSADAAGMLQSELEALDAACRRVGIGQGSWGVRQHYLRFCAPDTWRYQEVAGLEHDSTLGFADLVGFRAGTCREYPAFDAQNRRPLRIRERPLVVMDATLFGYMRLDHGEAARRVRNVIDACRRHGGDAVVCYHNSSLPRARDRADYWGLVADLTRQPA